MPAQLSQANAFLQQTAALRNRGRKAPVDDLSLDPTSPDYRSRMPPPEPDGAIVERTPSGAISRPAPTPIREGPGVREILEVYGPPQSPPQPQKRVLITFGPEPRTYIVSVVDANLHEVFQRVKVDRQTAVSVYALLREFSTVVDLVGVTERNGNVTETGQVSGQTVTSDSTRAAVPPSRPRRPRADSDTKAPRKGRSADSGSGRGEDPAGRDVGAAGSAGADADEQAAANGTRVNDWHLRVAQ